MKRLVSFLLVCCILFVPIVGFAVDSTEIPAHNKQAYTLSNTEVFVPETDMRLFFTDINLSACRVIDGGYMIPTELFISWAATQWYGDAAYFFRNHPREKFSASYDNGIISIDSESIASPLARSRTYTKSKSKTLGNALQNVYGKFVLEATFYENTQPIYYEVVDWNTDIIDMGNRPAPITESSVVDIGDTSVAGTYVSWTFKTPQIPSSGPNIIKIDSDY